MKRITKRDEFGNAYIDGMDMSFTLGLKYDDMVRLTNALNRLADYEDTERPKAKWIPCEEKLPDKGLRVLMQLNNAWQIVGWYDIEDAQWFELIYGEPVANDRVLAWMELPYTYYAKGGEVNETWRHILD